MKRTHWILIVAAAWTVSLATAYMMGRSTAGPASSFSKSKGAARASASGSSLSGSRGPGGAGGTIDPESGPKASLRTEDIPKELKAALEDPDLIKRGILLRKLLDGLNAENLQTVLEAFKDVGTDSFENLEAYRLLIYSWSRFDPASAMAYAVDRLGMRGAFVAQPAMANWVQRDANAALKWAKGLGGNEGQFAVGGVLQQMAILDPAEAARRLATLDAGSSYGRYAQIVADQYAKQDPKAAAAWAQTIADPAAQQRAVEEVVRTWAQADPNAAADWLRQNSTRYQMPDAAGRVASEIAEKNPSQAINWANQLPKGDNRTAALSSAVGQWATQDPSAAGNWINTHVSAGPEGDRIIGSYAHRVADSDPAAAITWAQSISDEGARSQSTVEVARHWYRQDQNAATSWLQSAPLSDQQKHEITRPSRYYGSGPPWRRDR